MDDETRVVDNPVAAKKVRRKAVRKPKSAGRKTAILFGIAVVLGLCNLVLMVQLGWSLR